MIEMTFTAEDAADLIHQIRQFVGQTSHDAAPRIAPSEGKDIDTPREPAKPKKAAVRPPVAKPEASTKGMDEFFDEEEAKTDAKSMLELKSETISKLQEAFANGKVTHLRKLLETYGEGAKSFPEIAPEKFGKIAEAIRNGALSDA